MKDYTEVVIKKGDYEFVLRINSRQIFDSDLEQIKLFVSHMHGIYHYDQRTGDRSTGGEK